MGQRASAGGPIRIERMEVHRGHLICRIAFGNAPRTTSPELMARVLSAFPTLPQHACVNECGTTFAAVMNCTPLPHLLEHMVVDLQVREESHGATIVGTSEWLNEQEGIARLDISFPDDLVALKAINKAVTFLNKALQCR